MIPPNRADPYRQVEVTVSGKRAGGLVDEAIRLAAVFLNEAEADLHASEVGQARVIERSRFRRHLGEEGHPIRWQATIKVRLWPEIVKARRDGAPGPRPRGRGHLHPL